MKKVIDYKHMLELGGEEIFLKDEIFRDKYGYEFSFIKLRINEDVVVEWNKRTAVATIYKQDADGLYIFSKEVDKEELEFIIEFFKT